MDLECFDRLLNQAHEAKLINEGLADHDAGNIIDGKTTKEQLSKKYNF